MRLTAWLSGKQVGVHLSCNSSHSSGVDFSSPTGMLERFHITRRELGLDACVIVCATYSSAAGSKLDGPTVLRALKKVVLDHAALCVRIDIRPAEVPRFVRLPTIDLKNIVAFTEVSEQPLEELIRDQGARAFDTKSELPLWRLLVQAEETVIFVYHHAIGDGLSGIAFHRAFRTALNEVSEGDGPLDTVVSTQPGMSLVPPVEQLVDVTVSWKKFLQTIYDTFAPMRWKSAYVTWTGNPIATVPNLKANVRLRKIDADTANALLSLCREHECTFTTFLHTLGILVLSHLITQRYPQVFGKEHTRFAVSIPVSARRFTGVSDLSIAEQISGYSTNPCIDRFIEKYPPTRETFPWTTSAKLRKSIQHDLKDTLQLIGIMGYMATLGIWEKYLLGQLGQKRGHTLELSNVGAMPRENSDEAARAAKWEADDVYFAQNNVVLGPAIAITVAGSPSGSIQIGYTWGSEVVDDALVESFIEELHGGIESIMSVS